MIAPMTKPDAPKFLLKSGSNGRIAWMEGVISYLGRQDNVAVRQAAFVALAINLLMVVAAIVSIMLTIPARKRDTGRVDVGAAPAAGPVRP